MKAIILSTNCVIDKHFYYEKFILGDENFPQKSLSYAGGKGVNVAKALNVASIPYELFLLLGKNNSEIFKELLFYHKLKYDFITTNGNIRENISIHTKGISETRLCNNDFYANDEKCIDLIKKAYDKCDNGDLIVISGSFPKGINKDKIIPHILNFKRKGCLLVLDSTFFDISDFMYLKPFLIKPNETEIKKYGVSEEEAIKNLLECGIENIAVSKGKKGISLYKEKMCITCTPPEINALSTVGAGDSSVAGFVYSIINNSDIETALKYAVSFGTSCCLTVGGEPPEIESIEKIKKNVKIAYK